MRLTDLDLERDMATMGGSYPTASVAQRQLDHQPRAAMAPPRKSSGVPHKQRRPEPWLLLALVTSIAVMGVVLWMIIKLWRQG